MELITKRIHTNQTKCRSDIQLTLEDDINVPDTKPDIDHIIKVQGEVQIQETTPETDRVLVRGQLLFSLLYLSTADFRPIHTMQGQIPFEESINMEDASTEREVHCHFDLEDCQAGLINSRKISIRSILSLHCCQDENEDLEIGVRIVSDEAARAEMEDISTPEGLHQQYQTMTLTNLAMQSKDIFRIKEESSLPKGKPNCESLLYYEMTPQGLATRLTDDGIRISGDLTVFVLYAPEDDERTLEFYETELPFDGVVSCPGCNEDMVADIAVTPGKKLLEFRPDEDGEVRVIDLEMTLHLDMKFYQEESFEYLKDAYSTKCELQLHHKEACTRHLRVKNQSNLRIADRIKIEPDREGILQICNASGQIQIDDQSITEDGILLEGVLEVEILYVSEDDARPLNVQKGSIPFEHTIEVRNIQPTDSYELQTEINNINVIMLDREEIEVKAVLNLSVLVFTGCGGDIVTSFDETPIDLERFQEMPGLIGYIVKSGDSLWSIAKTFHTTIDSIHELNHLERDEIHTGDKLLLLKQTEGIL